MHLSQETQGPSKNPSFTGPFIGPDIAGPAPGGPEAAFERKVQGDLLPTKLLDVHGLRLLPPDALLKTGPVDHADWNFRPVLGRIQQLRFKLVTSLLPSCASQRLLEIGYGSGVFLPELARHGEDIYGIDNHDRNQAVKEVLSSYGLEVDLRCGSTEALPYEDGFFDCIVAVSTLEFVEDIEAATREIARALNPDGHLVLVTPGHSALLDLGLKILTGESARKDYDDRRARLLPALRERFMIEEERSFPPMTGSKGLYRAFSMVKKV